ncbi:hypothetical protein CTEN210_13512 [Chaetoceros tenuissimus]|uniref:Leucine-rich repeat domain-containing protein n=1 Tax=Chaetoceros tenuissimus TaxID=426638 RepID=A0AAD3D5G2_9STRA|nr:hypothetical protein CTEN210_13512 [Chaetoceros tenuissimus]
MGGRKALGPGIHNFKRKVTLIYNGKKCWKSSQDKNTGKILLNNVERDTIEVIIILPGVYTIRGSRFHGFNVKTVIMADTVRRVEKYAFYSCNNLEFVRLSRNLVYIGYKAFGYCESLPSIFIPPSCREVDDYAFQDCKKLIIFNVPRQTQLGRNMIMHTALERASPFSYQPSSQWIKNVNMDNNYALHRECASMNPSEEVIYAILKERGQKSFQLKNKVGVAASRYLCENPYTDITEQKLIKRYVLELMGEIVN